MRYLSVCSCIEAATVAAPEGWHAAAFAEVDPFPSAVLAHRFPTVPNLGDFTKIEAHHVGAIDLLVGGTPCQSFSIAGHRLGLGDARGNLTIEYLELARRLRPRWIVWENVPGVMSIDGGRTFGSILGALGQLGYGFAYRVLDAQHFGVPQRRRRVFVVGCAGGDWKRAAAVLFEPESLRRHPAESRRAGKEIAGTLSGSTGGADENDADSGRLIAHTLRGGGHDASEDGTGRGTPLIVGPLAGHHPRNDLDGSTPLVCGTLQASGKAAGSATQQDAESGLLVAQCVTTGTGRRYDPETETPIACASVGNGEYRPGVGTLRAKGADCGGGSETLIAFDWQGGGNQGDLGASLPGVGALGTTKTPAISAPSNGVRRLLPIEAERLQGFPDNWTAVPYRNKPAADGPRYKAIGNSMAVPVMRWIFNRLDFVDRIPPPPSPPHQ